MEVLGKGSEFKLSLYSSNHRAILPFLAKALDRKPIFLKGTGVLNMKISSDFFGILSIKRYPGV